MGVVNEWGLTPEEVDEIITESPSLRGMVFGYVNESKLRKMWFTDARFTDTQKPDDHDRKTRAIFSSPTKTL
jgi:hypothetical protein